MRFSTALSAITFLLATMAFALPHPQPRLNTPSLHPRQEQAAATIPTAEEEEEEEEGDGDGEGEGVSYPLPLLHSIFNLEFLTFTISSFLSLCPLLLQLSHTHSKTCTRTVY